MTVRSARVAASATLAATLCLASGCASSSAGGSAEPPATAKPRATVVTTPSAASTVFATATPPNAPTQQMSLYHVDVPPGAVIAPHQHPGQQLSHLTAGVLTYTVLSGTVTVFGPPRNGQPGPSRHVKGPATIEVRAGQSLAEPAGEIHRATNKGPAEVRIDIAVLVPHGDPISVPER